VTGEEDRSLSRRVPPADEDHVFSPAAQSFDGRGPVGDSTALEVLQSRDLTCTLQQAFTRDDLADDAKRPGFVGTLRGGV
jgi:hypothetical protein